MLNLAAGSRTIKQIGIQGTQDTIHQVEILQGDGDRSVLSIGPAVTE